MYRLRGPPAIGRYHRLELFLPSYHPKSTVGGRFRVVAVEGGRKKKREKNLESIDPLLALRAISSPAWGEGTRRFLRWLSFPRSGAKAPCRDSPFSFLPMGIILDLGHIK
ncbi:hypothetical protein BHE74_00017035 [Ensete ventricosum]|nr:hypothetical protein BHE74_00017035 [Ensete ventricosum]